jgi:hypothetical protein
MHLEFEINIFLAFELQGSLFSSILELLDYLTVLGLRNVREIFLQRRT